MKTLEDFRLLTCHGIPAALIRHLAEGGYLSRSEPIIFMGEPGTGKTHLAEGLGVAACRQRKRMRFTTAAHWSTNWSKPRTDRAESASGPLDAL